jgi:hypothetical protein
MNDKLEPKPAKIKTRGKGDFFAIDRRTWAEVCKLGLYEAVAYLVLAQGTAGNNRSTSWSATSLKKYADVSWERGKPAIERLQLAGLIQYGEKHTREKPRYELLSWAEIEPGLHECALKEYQRRFDDLSVY